MTIALLGVASNLLHGVALLQQLDFETAMERFTRVVAASNTAPQMAQIARLLCAEAAQRAERPDRARAELEWLISYAEDPAIREAAAARRGALAGANAADRTGGGSLLASWRRLTHEVARGQWSSARRRIAGPLGQFADRIGWLASTNEVEPQAASGVAWLVRPWTDAKVIEVTSTVARGEIQLRSNAGEVRLAARPTAEGWVFEEVVWYRPPTGGEGAAPAPLEAANVPAGGVVVVAPDGARLMLGAAGGLGAQSRVTVAETTLAATGAPPPQIEPPAEERRRLEQLVTELGHADPIVRARARAALRAAGAAARSTLQAHRDHRDVEVATTVRELLDELR
ncbi:MAG: hypothetical protein N2652_06325 [Kiritimatiellae bacterium]|nr:hypothetical protein [Kiritimatiellia bacterium]